MGFFFCRLIQIRASDTMKVAEVLEEHELIELARAGETTIGRIYEKLATKEAEERLREIESSPRFNTVEGVEDIRFKLGARRGLLKILLWRQEAVKAVSKSQKGASQ